MKRFVSHQAQGLVLLLIAMQVHASSGIDNAGLFDSILQRFANTASTWGSKMVMFGTWLFWGLTLLSMVWTYGLMALKKADLQEFLAETIRFFTATGFFLWILQHGPAISMAIIDSLRQIASEASGLGKTVSPSGIVDIGFDIASKVIDMSSIWSPASSTVGLIIAAIILVVLALVSVNMLLILISAWLLAYGGVFLLGFGGGRWTQDIAIHYYKTVLGVGMQTFTMILIVGIGQSFIDQYYAAMGNEMTLKELFVMLVVAIILLSLVKKLPPVIAGIVGGGGGGASSGMSGFGFGAAVGAAGMATAFGASAGATALNAAASGAGGASAIKAAFQAANQTMASGSPSVSDNSATSSTSGLSQALGNAGRFATDMGAHLAKGTAEIAKDKLGAIKDAAAERIAATTGGKIATAINNRNGSPSNAMNESLIPSASNDEQLQRDMSGNTLSAGTRAASPHASMSTNDEVVNFVNKR